MFITKSINGGVFIKSFDAKICKNILLHGPNTVWSAYQDTGKPRFKDFFFNKYVPEQDEIKCFQDLSASCDKCKHNLTFI